LNAANEGLSVGVFHTDRDRVMDAFTDIAEGKPPSPAELAAVAGNRILEKWDGLLPEALLNKGFGIRKFDLEQTQALCAEILAEEAD
jgi:hypothetical protein